LAQDEGILRPDSGNQAEAQQEARQESGGHVFD
jgi:hypothetical protein